ncbi:MAG TPA: hypothetical protein VJ851_16200 [Jatrophihabitans sp.]|nr:hypothetical protein [Jatrophihabitans sp.]
MFRPSVLMLALVLSASTLWSAFAGGSIDITTALIRFLIAVPVAWAMLRVLRAVTAGYQPRPQPPVEHRSSVDSES